MGHFVHHLYPIWGTWGTFFHFGVHFFFFFFGPFCYKNVEKMFYQPQKAPLLPQKVTFSPQKVKKVKKVKKKFFYFFTYCVRKSHIYTYIFLVLGPLTPTKKMGVVKFFNFFKIFTILWTTTFCTPM